MSSNKAQVIDRSGNQSYPMRTGTQFKLARVSKKKSKKSVVIKSTKSRPGVPRYYSLTNRPTIGTSVSSVVSSLASVPRPLFLANKHLNFNMFHTLKNVSSSHGGIVNFANQGYSSINLPFRVYYSQSTPNNSSVVTITETTLQIANLGARVIDFGDMFTEWRLESLNMESFGYTANASGNIDNFVQHGMAVIGSDPSAFVTPTSYATLVDFPAFAVGNCYDRVCLKVGPRELIGSAPTKWFNTSTNFSPYIAGTIEWFIQNIIASTVMTSIQQLWISGEVTMRAPIDPALVPLKHLLKEKDDLDKQIDRVKTRDAINDFVEVKEEKI